MPLYESVFLVRPEARSERTEEITQAYSQVVQDHGGTVVGHEAWGLRTLAFPIKKNAKAHYVMLRLDAPHQAVAELEQRLKFDNEILRHLTVKVKAHDTEPSPLTARRGENAEGGERRGGRRTRDTEPRDARTNDKPEPRAQDEQAQDATTAPPATPETAVTDTEKAGKEKEKA